MLLLAYCAEAARPDTPKPETVEVAEPALEPKVEYEPCSPNGPLHFRWQPWNCATRDSRAPELELRAWLLVRVSRTNQGSIP